MEKAITKKKEVAATDAAGSTPSQEAKRPEQSFRVSDCSASVWAREFVVQGQPRVFRTVSFERSFKDKHGQYRYTKTFDIGSLGKIVTLCQQVQEYVTKLPETEREVQ